MKQTIWLWVVLFGINAGLCQSQTEIDSLRRLLRDRTDLDNKELRDISSDLGWLFYSTFQYDTALAYYHRALRISSPEPRPEWRGSIYAGIAATQIAQGKYDSAITYYRQALEIYHLLNDANNIASTHTNLSIVYRNLGLYEESLESALSAIKVLETKDASPQLASCHNSLAVILTKIGNYDEAAKRYREAITLFAKFNVAYQARSYNNLGELFILTHQYDSARSNLTRAVVLKRQLSDTKGVARTLSNLGKVSILTGNLLTAEEQLDESYSLQANLDDPVGKIEVMDNLGEFYLITQSYKQSSNVLKSAERIIREAGSPEYLRQNLEVQVRLARERKDFASGMILQEQLAIIRDSLLNEDKNRSLQAMQIRYETGKKEQQIALLQQREEFNQVKIRNSRIAIGSLVVGLILVISIGMLIYINLRNARASKEKIELLLSETRHRIKNNLQTLASIFHLQTRHYTDQEMVLEARSSESRVHTMSLLHEKFYSVESGNTVRAREYVTDLVHKLVDIYGVGTSNLDLSIEVDDIDLDVDKALALSLIIQELVCNAFKYAFDHEPDPKLLVAINAHDDEVTTIIRDNGAGLTGDSRRTSQGLNLVEALVTQLDGKMQTSMERGTTFTIRFPLTPAWKKQLFW